jgi:hypothetical protein
MKQKTKKFKIIRNGKSYELTDSSLYKIKSKTKLLSVLLLEKEHLPQLKASIGDYHIFNEQGKNGKPRTIEKPNHFLDKIQSRIASLLCRVKTPEFIHSGTKKRSHVSNAKIHANTEKTFTTDIKSFFPSTTREMVFNFFYKKMDCAPDVAELLTKICTCNDHVPTGSRISMPLSYWANESMFTEISNLSESHGITMTLYVDDITFSGNSVNRLFISTVKKIISRYGHTAHPKKSIFYPKNSVKTITGVVIKNGMPTIKNEQHMKMFQDIEQLKGFRKDTRTPPETLIKRTLGRINSLSIIEARFKDKAKSLRLLFI